MVSVRDRALRMIEVLARNAAGLHLIDLADPLDIPRSAAHRVLSDLKEGGYVRQDSEAGPYLLTGKLVSIASTFLAGAGITDLVQPALDRLAESSGELARLATIDGDRLTWIARSQGARHGLRYDPSDGLEVCVAVTSNGHAWLSCLGDEEALELVGKQGLPQSGYGPRAPRTWQNVLSYVREARTRGYAVVADTNEAGTSSIAAPVFLPNTRVPAAIVSIAGPSVRLTSTYMDYLAPSLLATSCELANICAGSPLFPRQRRSSTQFSVAAI